jgi:hypothetical protein
MTMYGKLPPGTWIQFNADSRLRQINAKGQREQQGMGEGVLIGEVNTNTGKRTEAVVVQPIGEDAHTVYFPEKNMFGWCWNYEVLVNDKKPTLQLNLVKQHVK